MTHDNTRIKRFQSFLRRKKISAALFVNWSNKDPNIQYFTGLDIDNTLLFIPKKGNSKILTSKLEYERAKRFSGMETIAFSKPPFEHISAWMKRKKTLAINKSVTSLNLFRDMKKTLGRLKYVDISQDILSIRKHKTPEEIKLIKKACSITDEIFKKLIQNFDFRTELDIERFLIREAQEAGCTMAFDPIVASGSASSMPHYRARNVNIKKGFMVLDFGVRYKGYVSDMTRTVHIGRPTKEHREMYSILLDVQTDTIRQARIGMKASSLMKYALAGLGRHRDKMIHALGHGIGVQVHELPGIYPKSKDRLEEGDVFTIEPGIYIPGKFGIRIEDDIYMDHAKKVILNRSPKELIVI